MEDLHIYRLINYFRNLRQQSFPHRNDLGAWTRLLLNTEIMVEVRGRPVPTTGGLLLFGKRPNRHLPQAGISAAAYTGKQKDYNASASARLVLAFAIATWNTERPDYNPSTAKL